jgi:hypothetical protein
LLDIVRFVAGQRHARTRGIARPAPAPRPESEAS